jgi:ketosteroid isomerase-like protein
MDFKQAGMEIMHGVLKPVRVFAPGLNNGRIGIKNTKWIKIVHRRFYIVIVVRVAPDPGKEYHIPSVALPDTESEWPYSFFKLQRGKMNKTIDQVLKANQAFYDAFAAGDYDRLERLWTHTGEISVIHPGSSLLHGRQPVMSSWRQILGNADGSNIRCADPRVYLLGDVAYVVCSEVFPDGRLIATNIFRLEDNTWRMVHHQAGPDNRPVAKVPGDGTSVH